MSTFDDTLARMKSLYTYGQELNEGNTIKTHTLEYKKKGADGRYYGIVRECSRYYIKTANAGRENIAENYDYIGGFCNKKDYEYDSYSNALKNLELKLASVNEACEAKVNISTLDPFRKQDIIAEATDEMKDMIARQRQIMYNTAMLMNESIEIGATRDGNTVKYNGKNPETPKGNGDETVYTENPEFTEDGFKTTTNSPEEQSEPFTEKPKDGIDQLKEGCGVKESCPSCGKIKEDCCCDDWASKGLPSDAQAGVGEADTDHNNNPFNKSVNEGEDEETDIDTDTDIDMDVDSDTDTDIDGETDDVDVDLDLGLDDTDDDIEGDTDTDIAIDDDGDTADIDIETEPSGNKDLLAQIEDLQSQIDALKAQVEGSETEYDFETDIDTDTDADIDTDAEEDVTDITADVDDNGDVTDIDMETDNVDGEDTFDTEDEGETDIDLDECGDGAVNPDMMYEAKRTLQKKIDRMVASILNETELHDFGKHPGYRKKPFTTDPVGSDCYDGNCDWNDKSVASDKPFGSEIGDGYPFDELVKDVVKDVMLELNKKKVRK